MPRPYPNGTPVFHIVPVEKLDSVIEHGLLCDNDSRDRFGEQAELDAAHPNLKNVRRTTTVDVAAGGVLADYVPFYFGPRSPMLYSIYRGNTRYGREGRGQEGMIHLVARLERLVQDFPGRWCFIDAHITRGWATFGDDLTTLDERIDFELMTARRWDRPDEVKAARQAEFLVNRVVPWEYVELIVVMNDDVLQDVADIIDGSGTGHKPVLRAQPPGYHDGTPFPHGYYY